MQQKTFWIHRYLNKYNLMHPQLYEEFALWLGVYWTRHNHSMTGKLLNLLNGLMVVARSLWYLFLFENFQMLSILYFMQKKYSMKSAALNCLDVSLDKVSCEMLLELPVVAFRPMVPLRDVDHTMTDNKIGNNSRKVISLKDVRSCAYFWTDLLFLQEAHRP